MGNLLTFLRDLIYTQKFIHVRVVQSKTPYLCNIVKLKIDRVTFKTTGVQWKLMDQKVIGKGDSDLTNQLGLPDKLQILPLKECYTCLE